jgi:transcriptional regulator with XRE-family HTH domain
MARSYFHFTENYIQDTAFSMPSKRAVKKAGQVPAAATADAINEDLGRRVKKLRGDRGWSLEELASASGVSRSMLSEIERQRANPTLSVTYRIARAFGLSLQDLLESADSASTIQTIRATDRAQIFRKDKQCQIRTLSPLNLEKDVEFYELRLPPNGALRSQPHVDGTREFLTVEEGEVELQSGNSSETLGKGDSATYRADVAHTIVNNGKKEAVLFLVVIYR